MTKKSSFIQRDVDSLVKLIDRFKDTAQVVLPKMPIAPTLSKPQINLQYEQLGAQYGVDPYEIRAIMEHAPRSNNDMVQDAFRRFLVIAKLSLDEDELKLAPVRQQARDMRKHYDNQLVIFENANIAYENACKAKADELSSLDVKVRAAWHTMLDGFARTVEQTKGMLTHMPVWDTLLAETISAYDGGAYLRIVKQRVVWSGSALERLKSIDKHDLIRTALNSVVARHRAWMTQRNGLDLDLEDLPDSVMELVHLLEDMQAEGNYRHDRLFEELEEALNTQVCHLRNQRRQRIRSLVARGEDGYEAPAEEFIKDEYADGVSPLEQDLLMHMVRTRKQSQAARKRAVQYWK